MEGDAPSRDVTRLVDVSDAVVAIAATLLVLPLVDQVDPGAPAADLLGGAGQQFGRSSSFVVMWLIGIVFLPYPTELIGVVGSDDRWDPVVYIGTLAVTSLAGLAMQAVIGRTPGLRAPGAAGHHDFVPGAVTALALLLALVLALAIPAVGLWLLFLLFATPLVIRLLARRRPAT